MTSITESEDSSSNNHPPPMEAQPSDGVEAQTNQLPHSIVQLPDAKLVTQASQVPDAKLDTEVSQIPDAKVDNKASRVPEIGGIQLTDAMKIDSETSQVPNATTDTGDIQDTDSIADNGAIQVTDSKIETEVNQVPDHKTDVEADTVNTLSTNSKLTANPIAEPGTSKPAASTAIVSQLRNEVKKIELPTPTMNVNSSNTRHSFLLDEDYEGSQSGTEEEQSAFMKELDFFFKESSMEFKPPKFYGEGLNCLKLWRVVTRFGGYDKVTSCKLWRQVGESFKPPKTCTTVSWTFRGFYEKALLDYERHKTSGGELSLTVASHSEPTNIHNQASGSGRARRDAAARAMQGWHSQRVLGNGEVSDSIIKDKNSSSLQKPEKQLKSLGLLKRKKPPYMEHAIKAQRIKPSNPQSDVAVVDIGQPANWVKINVQRTKDCFEVYALVPGLLREEVRVQSDPAGRLVISGEPENPDNPWGVTPFKKVVILPARIDPHQTSAVVTLHGQLFVRVPFEPSE
ncbi:hypothetical protein Ddye_010761 [Dipteronia dyeriana]|uniref:AT-rich interactive domain-containing protein 3 n=1 Tax=Dipteronia dyeriana TaxID=168575 RepID=A0AAD9XDZ3_9ROSI|nr:hypothetical protein Ddye_010761 [Dipteronia dyeriana]